MKRLPLIILFLLSITFKGKAQELNVYEKTIRLPDEFSATNFFSGCQDSNGFIWLTSSSGELYRYDGYEIKKYGAEHGLPAGGKIRIFENNENMIWLHYSWFDRKQNNVFIFDPVLEKAIPLTEYVLEPSPFVENQLQGINLNSDGSIWLHAFNGDIFEYSDKHLHYWGSRNEIDGYAYIHKASNSLAYHHDFLRDTSWIIHSINNDNNSAKDRYIPNNGRAGRFLSIPTQFSTGTNVLVEINFHKDNKTILAAYDINSDFIYLDSVSTALLQPYHIIGDKILKLSENGGAILNFDLDTIGGFEYSANETFLFTDNQNGWWTKNDNGELKRTYFKENLFQQYTASTRNYEWFKASRGIAVTNKGDVFISKGGSLSKISQNGDVNFYSRQKTSHLSGDFFGLQIEENRDLLWAAEGNDLSVFNLQTSRFEKSYPLRDELGTVMQTYRDKKGNMWIGGSIGLCLLDENADVVKKFNGYPNNPLPEKFAVFAFYENKSGLWISTGEGVILINTEQQKISRFHTEGKGRYFLPHNIIAHLQEDVDGTFWLASKGGGLIHWDSKNGEYEQFTTQNGLKNNVIYACYQDEFNQIWLPSNNGLMRFDKSTKQVIHYTVSDGLPDQEFNTFSHYEDSLGQLYFGGLSGAIRLDPKDFLSISNPYEVYIGALEKTNLQDSLYSRSTEEVLNQNQITIHPQDKYVRISFSLLNFENSDQWNYGYQIEGFHTDWQSLKGPSITINNLPFGEYKLRFRYQASGYTWKEYEHPITLLVLTPYYLTWWFITIIAIFIIIAIWLLFKWRLSASRMREQELELIVESRTHEISEQSEKLKSLDKMKTQFFANISHELRTPITLILGPVRAMQAKKNKGIDPFQLNSNLDVIDRNAENLLGLIEEVLDLSKLDAGKLIVKEKATSLIDFIRYVKSNFQTNADLREIQYHLNYGLSAKRSFYLDQAKVETILTNFLSNAFKFCSEKGSIIFEVEEKESLLVFKVRDNGIGIKQEDIPFVFDRFYQARSDNSNGGTGIGLSLSKELALLMDGQVWVESVFGEGSTFFFEIPLKEAPWEKQEIEQNELTSVNETNVLVPKPNEKKSLIMLVEDHPDMSDFIQSILTDYYKVIIARNGAEGLKLLAEKKGEIDLIISDVMMPIMDGFTFLKKLKEDKRWLNLPIIMLTAKASEEDKLHALTIGADDYLIKPFSSEELLVRIQNLLKNYEIRKLWKNELTLAVQSISNTEELDQDQKDKQKENEIEISKKDLSWLKEVEQHILDELQNEEFDIQFLSEKVFMSKRQFERRIKLITGLTPAKLVLEIRLKKGRKFLEDGHYSSVSEVSFAIGIQTPSYFSKLYANRYGRKPSSYFK